VPKLGAPPGGSCAPRAPAQGRGGVRPRSVPRPLQRPRQCPWSPRTGRGLGPSPRVPRSRHPRPLSSPARRLPGRGAPATPRKARPRRRAGSPAPGRAGRKGSAAIVCGAAVRCPILAPYSPNPQRKPCKSAHTPPTGCGLTQWDAHLRARRSPQPGAHRHGSAACKRRRLGRSTATARRRRRPVGDAFRCSAFRRSPGSMNPRTQVEGPLLQRRSLR
jgi:hypothetical protein